MECTAALHPEWFGATIGGLGLTGLIRWVEFQLEPIPGSDVEAEFVRFKSLEEFLELSDASNRDFRHTAAWLDILSSSAPRGIFMRGNFVPGSRRRSPPKVRFTLPCDAPAFLLNPRALQLFNNLYYVRQSRKRGKVLVSYDSFFFPLDSIGGWNRLYGRRGFFQYQCVVPEQGRKEGLEAILSAVSESREGSFLAVMKTFGNLPSPGMMSFPKKGVTVSLDFPHRGGSTLKLMDRLDAIVASYGGAVYPAKDARMSPISFDRFFPQWKNFARYVDPKFSSSFWRRVTKGIEA
jgi:FAD/FMN-containing dehydrogenase